MTDIDFVLTDDLKALMSMIGARELKLERSEALNGIPRDYWGLHRIVDVFGVSDHAGAKLLLESLESEGVAVAMNRSDTFPRMFSLVDKEHTVPLTVVPSNITAVPTQAAESGR